MSAEDPSAEYAANAAVDVTGDGGTVALLLHGLGGDRNQPRGAIGPEPLDGLTVVMPDQRGHGDTTTTGEPADFTTDQLADDAMALLGSLGLAGRPLIVGGISLGAAVALRILQRNGGDLRGGLLIRPAFGADPWPEHLRVFRDVARLLRAHGPAGLDEFVRTPAYLDVERVSASGAASLREQFTKPCAPERVVRLENVPANTSIDGEGAWAPPCEIAVVGAEADPVHPFEIATLWHERIAGSELIRLPSRDERPDDYASRLREAMRDRLSRWAR